MPELPEVEILARHLQPLLCGKTIRGVDVRRAKILKPTPLPKFKDALLGAKFTGLARRGKYLLFELRSKTSGKPVTLLGHLGMTGRMFVAQKNEPLPKHAAVVFELGRQNFIYEDTRYFGRMTLDVSVVAKLGPEPLSDDFQPATFAQALKRSRQAIKTKLLDQSLVAGVGNIYASEALFRARISPRLSANRLTSAQIKKLWRGIRGVLAGAIAGGSTVPLNFTGGKSDGLFYFGRGPGTPDFYEERLRVYDRAGTPCNRCGFPIKRIVQAARSTFYCPHCQI
ncbi:MAG: bifunctional DNA-formamidopyrimidine glycosylase/DNA-(apurinic or apyrimidinic site) lyase [Verrucomicrobiales bacterium]|nr:bifunctional DNA-formamidopyrimidine glycosylase/DNA-(apurinic or apyrimidinic site) lyase [Verrucomicrobiales bacterium]